MCTIYVLKTKKLDSMKKVNNFTLCDDIVTTLPSQHNCTLFYQKCHQGAAKKETGLYFDF